MSTRKRPLAELQQPVQTPSHARPYHSKTTHQHSVGRPSTARTLRHFDANTAQPTSARGILRRLAKITAPTTKRRTLTPQSTSIHRLDNKENIVLRDEEDDQDLKRPRLNWQIEESIEEDDSEILVAPTPSALLGDTDDEDEDEEQPTTTFPLQQLTSREGDRRRSRVSFLPQPQSDSVLHDAEDDGDVGDGNSTFLTERGRRAMSEEPTRMSRYSFGSIRMSEFGSELEVRRESDRLDKSKALAAEDDYGGIHISLDDDDDIHLLPGGETEDLGNLRRTSSEESVLEGEDDGKGAEIEHSSFQLAMPDEIEDNIHAHERGVPGEQPQLADNFLPRDQSDFEDLEDETPDQPTIFVPAASSRRQTLLESVAATAKSRPKRKLKMTKTGNMVPSLPSSLIKQIVHDSYEKAGKRKPTLGKDQMKALEQATEWFFEQMGEDLETYSGHGRRKKRIDSDDMLLLMRRQRVLRSKGDLVKMAKDWLPREVLSELDLPDRP